jgi:hypothetical protein
MAKRKMKYGPFEPMRGAWGQANAIQLESSVADDRDNTPWGNGTRKDARSRERDAAARRPAGALKPGQLRRARRLRLQGAGMGMTPATPDML